MRHPWRPAIELRPWRLLASIADTLHMLGLVLASVGQLGEGARGWAAAGARLQEAAALLKAPEK